MGWSGQLTQTLPRSLPMNAPRATKRDDLIETALELFCAHGIHAVGIDWIIEEAQVAKATLYKHFPSKDDLVLAALKHMDGEALVQYRGAVLGAADDPVERFVALASITAQGSRNGCVFVLAAQEFPAAGHPVHRASRAHKRRMRTFFAELAEAAGATDPVTVGAQAQLILDGLYAAGAVHTADGKAAASQAAEMLRSLLGR